MKECVIGSVDESHAIDVVDVSVFPIAIVHVVLWHGGFWAVEDGRLIHIIPYEGV